MHTEDVLKATRTGRWQWDSATGLTTVDLLGARLLGLPDDAEGPGIEHVDAEGPAWGHRCLSEAAFRARLHVADYVELQSVLTLAVAEGTLAEAQVRVVGEDGTVLRTVRSRMQPLGSGADCRSLVGTVAEVPGPSYAQTQVTGDWRREREAFLLDAGRQLAEARSTGEVLRVTASLAMPGFTPDGLGVFTVDGDQLTLAAEHGYFPTPEQLRPFLELTLDSPHPAAEVVRSGRAVYVASRDEYRERFPETWPAVAPLGRRSWAYLPLVVSGRVVGAWMAAFTNPVAFSPDERSVLTTVARMLAQALSRTALRESEREISAALQRTMRPVHKPDIEGMEVAARYVPTGGGLQVGGDWYDVIPLPSGRTALVIGDVQGHDVRAAGVMAQLRIALRAYAAEGHHPDAVLSRASRFLAGMRADRVEGLDEGAEEERDRLRNDPVAAAVSRQEGRFVEDIDGHAGDDRFATCLYIEVDPGTGTLDIARAGHPDPAIWLADGTMLVRPTAGGLPLGIAPDVDYPTTRLVLEPGETLLACTDGLLETGGHDMDSGWRRIQDVFAEQTRRQRKDGERDGHGPVPLEEDGKKSLERVADALVHSVHGPPSHHTTGPLTDRREDDIALLLLTHVPGSGAPPGAGVRRTALTVAQSEADRIGDARQQLQAMLYDWESEDQVDGAVLMLSEMLTNVLVHTEDDAVMVAECTGERGERMLRVEVADSSDELPHRRRPAELASHGRGLVLLEMLAGSWGVDPRGEGKSIWFELREDAPPPPWG